MFGLLRLGAPKAEVRGMSSAHGDAQPHLGPDINNSNHVGRDHPSDTSTPFIAADHANDGKHHLLLAASGSVATIKLPNIVEVLSHYENLSIRMVLTKSAKNFLAGQSHEQPTLESLNEIQNVDGIYFDEDEWDRPWTRGGGILHIELRKWSHLLAITPLSANTMAKMTAGMADNLLLSVIRAWDTTGEIEGESVGRKKIIVAAAMNTVYTRERYAHLPTYFDTEITGNVETSRHQKAFKSVRGGMGGQWNGEWVD